MTDRDSKGAPHEFSEGEGFEDPYAGFDLDPPELAVDPSEVDPVDSHVVSDLLDERQLGGGAVDVSSLIDVGLNYIQINRHEQAVDAFERAAQFADDDSPDAQEAWVNAGVAHAELEEYDDAIGAYREALRIDEEGEFAASAHANLAYSLWEFGKGETAFYHAEEGVRLDQHHPQAWYNLGYIQSERGQDEDAVECFDNALRLGFRNASVFEEKARALSNLGREAEAEEAVEKAEEIRDRAEREMIG